MKIQDVQRHAATSDNSGSTERGETRAATFDYSLTRLCPTTSGGCRCAIPRVCQIVYRRSFVSWLDTDSPPPQIWMQSADGCCQLPTHV